MLPQVALLVFMAHIGSFVPAASAHLGIIDAIYTRIRTVDSSSVQLSTYMIDIKQVIKPYHKSKYPPVMCMLMLDG